MVSKKPLVEKQMLVLWVISGSGENHVLMLRAPDKLCICVFYAMKTSKNACIIVYTLSFEKYKGEVITGNFSMTKMYCYVHDCTSILNTTLCDKVHSPISLQKQ
jgi:hypothetical protein